MRDDNKQNQHTLPEDVAAATTEERSSATRTQSITKLAGLVNCGDIHCCVQLVGSSGGTTNDGTGTTIVPGEKAQVKVSFLNNSTTVVKSVGMDLKQKSHYYAKNQPDESFPHPREISKTLWRMNNLPLNGNDNVAQRNKSILDYSNNNKTATTDVHSQEGDEEEEDNDNDDGTRREQNHVVGERIFTLPPLPDKALNTFQSKNHYVRHQLKVTFVTEVNHSNVVMKMPVTIGPAPAKQQGTLPRVQPARASARQSALRIAVNQSLRV